MTGPDNETASPSGPSNSVIRMIPHATTTLDSHQQTLRDGDPVTTTEVRNEGDPNAPTETSLVTESWQRKSLLSFDGGGIRGYGSLLMLKELMVQIGRIEHSYAEVHGTSFNPCKKPEELKTRSTGLGLEEGAYFNEYLPCHYFDYIVGTSTGGLIATMLSRWRMSVAECIQKYEEFGEQIFGKKRKISVLGYPQSKHSKKPLIEAIKQLAKERTPNTKNQASRPEFEMFPSPPDLCRTIVVAIRKGRTVRNLNGPIMIERHTDGPFLFRSYRPQVNQIDGKYQPMNYDVDINHEIWKVCRATTAAPPYFDSQEIGVDEFCDGGAGANNPTMKAWDEMNSLHKNQLKVLASFGTGKPESGTIFKKKSHKLWIGTAVADLNSRLKTLKAALTECEKTHDAVGRLQDFVSNNPVTEFHYFRLNVEDDLGKVKLNEWKTTRDNGVGGRCTTLDYIRMCTERELKKPTVKKDLHDLAKLLVKLRRSRIQQDRDRWDRFVCCELFKCPEDQCRVEGEILSFHLRREMREHLQDTHHVTPERMQFELERHRHAPEFPAGPF